VFRQLLTESAVLAALGGAAGLAAAWAMTRVLQSLAPAGALPADATGLDPRATATALAAACLTALAFGMLPAWSASSIAPGAGLRDGERTTGTAGTERIRGLLVAGEVALAIVLLCGAVLLVRSVQRLERADPGVVTAGVVAAPITLPAARYAEDADVRRFYRELVDRLERIPGIESASAVSRLPAGGPGFGLGRVFLVDGAPEPPAGPDYPAMWNVVTPRYFATVRQALVKGRGFTDDDTAESRPVVVIGEAMARRMFPGADPIGRRIRSWRDENLLREVVGVVGDVRYFGAGDELRPMVYVPHAQNPWSVMLVAARVGGDPRAFAAALRREVAAVDPELAIGEAGTLEGHRTASMAGPRFTTAILAAFAGTALVLTLAGIYGLMAYVVAQRRRELGVRVALGARPVDLRLAVLGRAAAVTMAGTIGGLACAVLSSRLVESFVFEASSRDLVAFGWVAALLLAAALSASLVPAERAARVDAVSALRGE
jgi:putative ABC transport system permease protein